MEKLSIETPDEIASIPVHFLAFPVYWRMMNFLGVVESPSIKPIKVVCVDKAHHFM